MRVLGIPGEVLEEEDRHRAPPLAGSRSPGNGKAGRRRPGNGLESEGDVPRELEPLLRILLQAAPGNPLESRRSALDLFRHLRRLVAQDRGQGLRGAVAAEGTGSREHLVEDGAEREYVRSDIGRLTARLLGRHVADRSQDDPRLGSENSRNRRLIHSRHGMF